MNTHLVNQRVKRVSGRREMHVADEKVTREQCDHPRRCVVAAAHRPALLLRLCLRTLRPALRPALPARRPLTLDDDFALHVMLRRAPAAPLRKRLSRLQYSKMLGGASQTVSKIRVKCNGT